MSFSKQLSILLTELKTKIKLTDKKNVIDNILNLYKNPDVIREISYNTVENIPQSLTWDQIINTVQQIIIDESIGKSVANKTRISNLAQQTFEHSNTMLTNTDFSCVVLEILGKEMYAYCHQIYIKALQVNILPLYACRLRFLSETWQNLLKVCVNLYPNQTSSKGKRLLLNTILSVVEYGCLESHLSLTLKKFLPVLEEIFKSAKLDQMLAESAFQLASKVCRQIAIDGRFALCNFGETILPNIVFLEGRAEKYILFLILIQAHHPNGATFTDFIFYAGNAEEWKQILQNMFSMIVKESRAEVLSLPFVNFASAVFRQITKLPKDHQSLIFNSEYDQPAKKRRLSVECGILVNTLDENQLKMSWPMIQILANLLKKYPDSLELNEFSELVRIVKSFFSKLSEHKFTLGSLCQLAMDLIPIQEKFILQDKSVDDKNYGSEILNSLLRCLHSVKSDELGHHLIQSLIENGKISNFDVIIRAYVTQAMKWSPNSVRTLLLLCRHATLPEKISQTDETVSTEPLKNQLLKWLFNIPWQSNFSEFPLNDLTEILSTFPLKFWCKDFSNFNDNCKFLSSDGHNLKIRNETSLLDDIKQISLSDINRCHLSLAFQIDLFDDLKMETNCKKLEAKQFSPVCQLTDLQFITSELCLFLEEDLNLSNVGKSIVKNMIVARAASGFEELNLEEQITFQPLFNAIQNSLEKIFSFLEKIDFSKHRLADFEVIFNALSAFFEASYHDKVTEVILSSISQSSLSHLYCILAVEHFSNEEAAMFPCPNINEPIDPDFPVECPLVELPKPTILKLRVTRALKNYCCLTIDSQMNEIQVQLISSLINNNISEICTNVDIKIATLLLEITNKDIIFTEEILETLIEYLVLLFSAFYRNQKVVGYILRILPVFFNHAKKIGLFPEKLLSILLEIDRNIKKEMHGPLVHLELLKCIGKLFSIDSTFKSLSQENSTFELILKYVNNPFLIVRLETARCIYRIFSSKEVSTSWKRYFYDKLVAIITSKEDNSEETEATILASYLYIITAVMSSDSIFQNQVLSTLLQLYASKRIPMTMIEKVLKIANCSLEQNLDFLLLQWCSTKSFDSFPWAMVGSSLESSFPSQMHIPIIKKTKSIPEVQEICEKLGLSFEEQFKISFPKLVAWLLFYISREEVWAEEMFQELENNEGDFQLVGKKFDDLVKETLDQVIVNLVQGLDDEDHLSQLFNVNCVLPESIPVRLKTTELEKCIKFLEEKILKQDLIRLLVTEQKSVLQKVLLALTCNIYETDKRSKLEKLEHKLKAFHQYVYFCTALMRELKNYFFEEMWIFVVRDICSTLLHLMKNPNCPNQANLSELACQFLDEFLSQILPERSEAVKEFFVFIVRTLTPLALSDKSSNALQTLRFLIVDQKEVFSDVIQKLNSFPQIQQFQEIRTVHESLKLKYTLESEIEDFLTVTEEINLPSNASSLLLLKGKLLEKKKDLNDLYKKLENLRGFAEDSASSVLHQLIYRLVKLTESSNPIVSQEAVKCLGILGPGDLTTMILHQEKTEIKENTDGIETLTYKILILLSNYIIEEDIELRKMSADALYAVLDSFWGQKLMNPKYLKDFEKILDKKETRLCVDRIQPFIVKSKANKNRFAIDKAKFKKLIDRENPLWKDQSNCLYFDWIRELSCKIAESFCHFYLESLIPIFQSSLQFCEEILFRIVNIMIHQDCTIADDFCNCINQFFRCNSGTRDEGLQKSRNQDSIRYMLNLVNFLRIQDVETVELRFDYLPIAKAAQLCSAYFTSVLYVELWCENFLNGKRNIESSLIIDRIYNKDPLQGKMVKDIIREASIKIGDPDAVYGCGTDHLKDRDARLQYFADLQQWDQMVILQDSKLRDGNDSVVGMLSALQNSGYQYLLSRFIKTVDRAKESSDIDDFQYECAWRLANWNLSSPKNSDNSDNILNDLSIEKESFPYHHYKCLKSFHDDDSLVLKSALDSARLSIIKDLRNISSESCKAVYPSLSKLRMLQEIEELSSAEPHQYQKILSDWNSEDYIRQSEFQYIEPLLWQRSIMCKIKDSFKNDNVLKKALIEFYLEIAEIASQQGYLKEASRSLGTLEKEEGLSQEIRNQLHYQEALLAWVNKDEGLARSLLRNLINRTNNNHRLHAESLRVFGNWMAETQSGNRQTILQKYYLEAIRTFMKIEEPSSQDLRNLNNTQAALARFADVHYRQLKDYMQSSEFDSVRKVAELSLVSNRSDLAYQDRDVRIAVAKNKKQTVIDAASLEETEMEKNYYLSLALEFYVKTLRQSEEHNFIIFRVVSLWLDNINLPKLNKILNDYLPTIASYKFIQMLPQLAAHMNDEDDEFSLKINNILERCALDHPFHALPVILALKHLYEDAKFTQKSPKHNKIETRVVGATKLINSLSKSTKISSTVREMEQLALALVQLAYFEIPRGSQKHNIPRNQDILKIKNFENAIVPTITLDVRPNKNYEDVIGVGKYLNTFETVGGINAPKKLICIGTDGLSRIQLVKGQDDLRQDAVMQQVFSVMNLLLKASKETKQRKLVVRTYKVVPLTQRSGILEWCENTLPIQTILLGTSKNIGVHKKYYPNDYTVTKCRNIMEGSSKRSNDVKLKAYMDCCNHMTPAFHHFFMETYSSPETWFERRLAYTRSVAVTSIVGYILGIGDRHLLNILLDQITAEVIHIDFGIAFEQGKVLPVPELIPFRLTRDIEVAMGISGVEGVMRRCCEQTMKVLREQKEVIVTLLQVLLYDPLFTWAITPSSMCRSSDSIPILDSDLEINKIAERALLRVQQKLTGMEEALPSSIEGQIERLLQQARDPALLSRIYFGWQAYL